MSNLESYYCDQAGSGIPGFHGLVRQRGFGFFGRILHGVLLPFLKSAGKKAAAEGIGLAEDLMAGNKFKETAKRRGKALLKSVAKDAIELAKSKFRGNQHGNGIIGRIVTVKRKKQRKRKASKRRRRSVKKVRRKKKVGPKKRKKKAKKTKRKSKKAKKSSFGFAF